MIGADIPKIIERSFPSRYEPIRESLTKCFTAAGISLAVVHGSQAQGRAHEASDLDVGLLGAQGEPLSYSRMGRLAADLSELLSTKVDVSDLATTDAIFRFEVAKCARVLFEEGPKSFSDFLAKTLIDYADIQRFVPELVAGVARKARRQSRLSNRTKGSKA
ncbi:MAG: putative nucleotidyltransferase [Hyphomicrobiaceae bacterium]|jgi:predicted nucleotidyltransferase